MSEPVSNADELESLRADLAQRTAERDALKPHDPLAEMWRELEAYQPQADREGHGESWARMCSERTKEAAEEAANCVREMSEWDAAWAVARIAKWAGDAVAAIRRAKEAKP